VLKRPGVDYYLRELGRDFEIVVYTASLSKYATRDSSFII
jgi:RNA polymerase II subunit A small phosphatase-like protein